MYCSTTFELDENAVLTILSVSPLFTLSANRDDNTAPSALNEVYLTGAKGPFDSWTWQTQRGLSIRKDESRIADRSKRQFRCITEYMQLSRNLGRKRQRGIPNLARLTRSLCHRSKSLVVLSSSGSSQARFLCHSYWTKLLAVSRRGAKTPIGSNTSISKWPCSFYTANNIKL